eukprot:SAG31_NODE_4257_length_3414_cov_1.764706_3_plen_41_part_00
MRFGFRRDGDKEVSQPKTEGMKVCEGIEWNMDPDRTLLAS